MSPARFPKLVVVGFCLLAVAALRGAEPAESPSLPLLHLDFARNAEGVRLVNGGIEFAAGDRDCVVQVSTTNADADRASALELIPKLRERIG